MQVVEQNLEEVLVLEDDVDFQPDLRENLRVVLDEAHRHTPSWDLHVRTPLITSNYVGSKILIHCS